VARLVKRSTGKTVTQHIRTLRVNRACEWLESSERSYAEIAYDLGFADQSYFIKQFREVTGTTPARYRKARQRMRLISAPLSSA
jgi:AraC-like DNA-binding protein